MQTIEIIAKYLEEHLDPAFFLVQKKQEPLTYTVDESMAVLHGQQIKKDPEITLRVMAQPHDVGDFWLEIKHYDDIIEVMTTSNYSCIKSIPLGDPSSLEQLVNVIKACAP